MSENFVDRGIEVGKGSQRRIAEAIAGGTRVKCRSCKRNLEQRFVASRDAHRDSLRLMLDGIDRTGEFLDAKGEGGSQIVEHDSRGANLAIFDLVRLERNRAKRKAQQRPDLHRR